jgi:diamine N-acetyltransferase
MQGKQVYIRKAGEKDVELISRLSSETFYETFASQNTKEDMEKYLLEKFNTGVIESELKDELTAFFIAYFDDQAVGYTKLRQNKIPEGLESEKPLEIERIYVYKSYQNKKIGAALMQNNIDHALQNGFDTLWLGVWEHNLASVEFYKKWGFEIFGRHIFRLGNDDQNDLLMKKSLK